LVKIRLSRFGKKKQPFYRIVAISVSSGRQSRALGQVGTYDPLHSSVKINEENALLWLNRGAVMTETVKSLFQSQGLLARWKGLEGTIKEGALDKNKPKRRRKLAASAAPVVEEATAAPAEQATDAPAEEAATEQSEG
jgi:small subunit ribosomal protein S16